MKDINQETLSIWEASYNHAHPDDLTAYKRSTEYEKKLTGEGA